HHLEAMGQVVAHSKEMDIHDTDKLIVRFSDAAKNVLPPAAPAVRPAEGGVPAAGAPASPAAPASAPAVTTKPIDAPAKPQKPIDLSAHLVVADVIRTAGKNDLKHLRTEGKVRVLQEPATPDDKGVDIRGDT